MSVCLSVCLELHNVKLINIHNIIPTNLSLYKMNVKETPQCEHCLFQNEFPVHMFLECSVVEPFWKDVNNVVEYQAFR